MKVLSWKPIFNLHHCLLIFLKISKSTQHGSDCIVIRFELVGIKIV
jgi:hypothetical protein